jgi:hypothetical protein
VPKATLASHGPARQSARAPGSSPAAGGPPAGARPLLALQRSAGNRAVAAALLGGLRVMAADHPLERAAARAGRMGAGAPQPAAGGALPPLAPRVAGPGGAGGRLSLAARAQLEPHVGRDLSSVRVHADERAHAMAEHLGARAFAVGGDLYFRRGRFDPSSPGGRALILHELTHVAQQERGARVVQRQPEDEPAKAPAGLPAHAYPPWTNVWIGNAGLVGEVVEAGVAVRIFESYDDLGIDKRPEYQAYECGPHDLAPIPDHVKKMRDVAGRTAALNAKLPAGAKQRVTRVAIIGGSSENAYRTALGEGLIVLARTDFDAGTYADTIAHEGSHGIFEYHSVAGSKDEKARVPDALALRFGDLYNRLRQTKGVPVPTGRFEAAHPPALEVGESESAKPAGLIMVMDVLWSGEGGHPWGGVDEFFASANGAYRQSPKVLSASIAHYAKADPSIKALGAELLTLLAAAGDTRAAAKLKAPKDPKAGEQELGAVGAPPDESQDVTRLGWLVDPTTMPGPRKILCPQPERSDAGERAP